MFGSHPAIRRKDTTAQEGWSVIGYLRVSLWVSAGRRDDKKSGGHISYLKGGQK